MTAASFRRLARGLAGVTESTHGGHPDFRVGGKVFATLGYPDEQWGMVKLTPELQSLFIGEASAIFKPAQGAWGIGGATLVLLAAAGEKIVRRALEAAWRNRGGAS